MAKEQQSCSVVAVEHLPVVAVAFFHPIVHRLDLLAIGELAPVLSFLQGLRYHLHYIKGVLGLLVGFSALQIV
jgi:hypothetical protein